MNKKINLLELCLSPDLGGLELYMVRAAKALDESMNVLSVINPAGKLEQYYQDTPYRYVTLKKKSNLVMFASARKLAQIIDEHEIDIVHLHWTKDIPIAVTAKVFSKRKPKLVQTRNMTMTRFKNDFYHRFLYRNIDLMLPVTHQVADQIKTFIPESVRPKVEVLYMGSDRPELLDAEGADAVRRELGMEDTFAVGINDPSVHAYFVGHEMKKGYTDQLRAMAEKLGVSERIHFLGFMKNPHHFYQACDAVVLASKRETFGLVLIEAMQAGTAVIGSNSGGVVEIIDDNETGLLFEALNSESLAEKIALLKDEPLKHRLAEAGRIKAEKVFSNEKQFEALKTILMNEKI
jgi:glycosyltransferase involved in cell wall biosynthesis